MPHLLPAPLPGFSHPTSISRCSDTAILTSRLPPQGDPPYSLLASALRVLHSHPSNPRCFLGGGRIGAQLMEGEGAVSCFLPPPPPSSVLLEENVAVPCDCAQGQDRVPCCLASLPKALSLSCVPGVANHWPLILCLQAKNGFPTSKWLGKTQEWCSATCGHPPGS